MRARILNKLAANFGINNVEVIDVSSDHTGHIQNASESHFDIYVCSERFYNISIIERQRMVYRILADEMHSIHAISMNLTPMTN